MAEEEPARTALGFAGFTGLAGFTGFAGFADFAGRTGAAGTTGSEVPSFTGSFRDEAGRNFTAPRRAGFAERDAGLAFFAGVLSEITGNAATAPGSISDEIFTSRRSFSEGENDLAGGAGAGAGAG